MGVGNFQARWIGWPGVYVEDGADRSALTNALAAENYIPVYLDANTVRLNLNTASCHEGTWDSRTVISPWLLLVVDAK